MHVRIHTSNASIYTERGPLPTGGRLLEVILPVGLPDEGTFDWLDKFLAKNRNLPKKHLETIPCRPLKAIKRYLTLRS